MSEDAAVMGQFEDAEPMLQQQKQQQQQQEQPQNTTAHLAATAAAAVSAGGEHPQACALSTAAAVAAVAHTYPGAPGASVATHSHIPPNTNAAMDQMSAHYAADAYATYEDALEQQQQQNQEEPHESTTTNAGAAAAAAARKKRICKFPGCNRVVKSQGHCQGHGAKAKRCSVEGCDKQAQATHEGMCKRHWRLKYFPGEPDHAVTAGEQQQNSSQQQQYQEPPKSVYETVLPQSIAFRPTVSAKREPDTKKWRDPLDPPPAPEGVTVMPLVAYLKEGATKAAGWHRNEERQARGIQPVAPSNLSSTQLEPWERQLAVVEVLLLGGGTPYASFKDLAHGWGRRKGFHSVLINNVCERRGEIIRKRKTEIGVPVAPAATGSTNTATTTAATTTTTTIAASLPKQQRIQQQHNNNSQHAQLQQQQEQHQKNHQTTNNVPDNNHHPQYTINHEYDSKDPPEQSQNHRQQPEPHGQYYEGLPEGYDPNEHQVI